MSPKDNPAAPVQRASDKKIPLVGDEHKGVAYVYAEPTSAGEKKRKKVKWSVPNGLGIKLDGLGKVKGGKGKGVQSQNDGAEMTAEIECDRDTGCVEYQLFYLDADGKRKEAYGRKLQGNDPPPMSKRNKSREGADALFVNPPPIIVFP